MSQVNLQLLAKELGLSIGTISKALRDSHEISAETKKVVLELAKKLNYTPNPYASSLRRKKSNTIAVVIPEVADSFFAQALRGIDEIAQSKGYHVLVYLTYESYDKEKKILEDCMNGRVDGVLMSVSSETNSLTHVEELKNNHIPIVFFDRALEKISASKVTTNDFDSAYAATAHLIDNGCQNIAFLSISDMLDMSNDRMKGFQKAVSDYNFPVHKSSVINCTGDAQKSHAIIRDILQHENRPDGVIASVEKLAIPVYANCIDLNIQIPGDLKVVCFSTTEYAQMLRPSLTTITQPANEIGKAAATLLFKELKKSATNIIIENIVLPSELNVRESTEMHVVSSIEKGAVSAI